MNKDAVRATGKCAWVKTISQLRTAGENFGKRSLDKLGLPLFDCVYGFERRRNEKAYLMAGRTGVRWLGDEL